MDGDKGRPSVIELLQQLGREVGELIRAELAAFKDEMMREVRGIAQAGMWFGAAALFGVLALAALTAFLILALTTAMPAWAAALAVTVLYGAIAGGLALAAKSRLDKVLPLRIDDIKQSVKEDVAWIRSGIKSANE